MGGDIFCATAIRTNSGLFVDLANPKPSDFRIADIAHALSRLERFTGHTDVPCNVAAHSVAVMRRVVARHPDANPSLYRAALLHDAAEAYVGDLNAPAKNVLRALSPAAASAYDELEASIMDCIYRRFDADPSAHAHELVKEADRHVFRQEYHAWTTGGLPTHCLYRDRDDAASDFRTEAWIYGINNDNTVGGKVALDA